MEAAEQPQKVSIIVASLNNEQTIGECLNSIFNLDYPPEHMSVFVVDGGSRDSTLEIVKRYPAQLFIKPLNAPAAYNFALKMTDSPIVGFIDADAKVERDWLKKLIVHLRDPMVAGASGTIKTWNPEAVLPRCIGYDLEYRYSRIKGEANRVATMNLLMKKSVIEEVGGFNENLPTQYDTEIGVRITRRGYKIILDPEAKCYHHHRSTWKDYFKQQFNYGRNTLRLYLRMPTLVKGDAITDWSMNVQPILLAFTVFFAMLGFFEKTFWSFSAALAALLFAIFLFHAVKIACIFQDAGALMLIAVYFVRAVAWTLGGFASILELLRREA